MSYMLQFPPGPPLPRNARSPPYALFGINGKEVFSELPDNIPLALVLHLAPKLRTWLLPEPEVTPSSRNLAMRNGYRGIDIYSDIDVRALKWIVVCMLQLSGRAMPKEDCLLEPTTLTCIYIHKAWLALELPAAGLHALHFHLQSQLMLGPPVHPTEIKEIWEAFPSNSPIVREMGLNFVRSHLQFSYTQPMFASVRYWYLQTRERTQFFKGLESQFPEFEDVQTQLIRSVTERASKVMEKKTRRCSGGEKRDRQSADQAATRRRMERGRGDEGQSMNNSHSHSVDSIALHDLLEGLSLEQRLETEQEGTLKVRNSSPPPPHLEPEPGEASEYRKGKGKEKVATRSYREKKSDKVSLLVLDKINTGKVETAMRKGESRRDSKNDEQTADASAPYGRDKEEEEVVYLQPTVYGVSGRVASHEW